MTDQATIDVALGDLENPDGYTRHELDLMRVAHIQIEACRILGGKLTVKRGKARLKVTGAGVTLVREDGARLRFATEDLD